MVRPRKVRVAKQEFPEVWGDRYVAAVEKLEGAPDSVLLRAAEVMAEEVGCTAAEAMEAVSGILARKAERDAQRSASFRRGRTGRSAPVTVMVRDLRPADELVETRLFAGEVVRRVSLSSNGLNAVITFQGRGDDDGWALRPTDTLRVRRG